VTFCNILRFYLWWPPLQPPNVLTSRRAGRHAERTSLLGAH